MQQHQSFKILKSSFILLSHLVDCYVQDVTIKGTVRDVQGGIVLSSCVFSVFVPVLDQHPH